jgi:Arc/MetJ-type ribon-helix-helix transcriptional regulator
MGVIQVQLPDELKAAIDRQVAEGRAVSEAEFILEAARRYAEDLEAEADDEIELAAMVERADADMAAGRFVTVSSKEDSEALHQRMIDRLRANLASGNAWG